MKPNTSNNGEHEPNMPEIIDYIHTSGLFSGCNEDSCNKCGCPAYASCPNCIMHKMEDVFKQGYAKAQKEFEKKAVFNEKESMELLDRTFEEGIRQGYAKCKADVEKIIDNYIADIGNQCCVDRVELVRNELKQSIAKLEKK